MNIFPKSFIIFSGISLLFLAACSASNQATNSPINSQEKAPTETAAKTEATAKDGEKHSEGDGHDHSKDGNNAAHKGQVVEVGKYHLEFKPDIQKEGTHLDVFVHDEQDKEIKDAKLTAQIQLPDGSNKTLEIPYKTDEKHYGNVLRETTPGDYKVVVQSEINGEKFNGRFNFKR
ncbi:hypothetical protein IQ264_04585 [Phormidium sp. LEGE 05292]|uniref:hypothetical protein n=1 Tax=[Phormidium] sp. LEGE 05292 TaxID=767427 RepID=UPI00187F2429|nr:hypothetical protein [Phormidium sp. LEGE 05292]MBE9224744.1 hypothetical protein [Phormidium sp. LEGE 05292]